MKKISFVTTLILSGVYSTLSLAQNYYDPGFYQNRRPNYGYANNTVNYAYSQNYEQQANYNQQYNYGNHTPNKYPPQEVTKKNKHQRGVGTISVGADYVLGYSKFNSKDYNIGKINNVDYMFDTNEFNDKSDAISLNMGWRPFKHIGIEAYYLSSFKNSQDKTSLSISDSCEAKKESSYQSYGVDIIGYYPINDYIEFLASIGVGKYDFEGDVTVSYLDFATTNKTSQTKKFEESITAYRVGGGFQLWLSRHMALRLTGRWVSLGGDFADYITEVNMGVRYHF